MDEDQIEIVIVKSKNQLERQSTTHSTLMKDPTRQISGSQPGGEK
jgi:hypothetical protein